LFTDSASGMEEKTKKVLLFLVFLHVAWGFLDFEELENVHYGISILNEPKLLNEEVDGSVFLASMYGQPYQCIYRDLVSEEKKEKTEEAEALEIGIPELLRPMEGSPCLVFTKGWWTYEFCYRKHIRQYHMEDGKPKGNIMYLGYYESDFEWDSNISDDGTQARSKRRNKLNKYHSQQYVNGSKCDLTSKPREVEVRFICNAGEGDYILRVDEPETCIYTITVSTTKICHHPYLKPPPTNKPVPIECNPVLNKQQFAVYLQEKEEERVRLEEEMKRLEEEKIRKAEEAMQKLKDEKLLAGRLPTECSLPKDSGPCRALFRRWYYDSEISQCQPFIYGGCKGNGNNFETQQLCREKCDIKQQMASNKNSPLDESLNFESFGEFGRSKEFSSTVDALTKAFTEGLRSSVKDMIGDVEGFDQDLLEPDVQIEDVKMVGDPKDIDKVIKEALETAKNQQKSTPGSQKTKVPKGPVESENVKNTPQSGTVLDDVENEAIDGDTSLDAEDEEDEDDDEFLDDFDGDYNKIADNKEKRVAIGAQKAKIKDAMTAKFGDIIKEAEAEEGVEANEETKGHAYTQLAKTLTKLLDRLEKAEKDIQNVDEHIKGVKENDLEKPVQSTTNLEADKSNTAAVRDSSTSVAKPPDKTSTNDEENIKIRVTRLKAGESMEDINKKASLKIPDEQKEELENTVKEELEKAGLDTGGRPIEIKIIATGYMGEDDENVHTLSGDETKAFNKMLVAFIGAGGQEAHKEQKRQDKMEENYSYVFGKNKKSQSSQSATQPKIYGGA
ncbi:unnamed protein product, partial [Owenia fusiformis]